MLIIRPNCVIVEEEEKKPNLKWILRAQEAKLDAQSMYERNNVCPNCHLVLPTCGQCDICGYTKRKNKH